jgi:hypothetical protein
MRKRILLAILLSISQALVCAKVLGQTNEETIQLGSQRLALGMPRELVLSSFAGDYRLIRMPGWEDGWLVMNKITPARVLGVIGQLYFKDGKLLRVRAEWDGSGQEKGAELMQRFLLLLSEFEKEDKKICSIKTQQGPSGITGYITCGRRYIEVNAGSHVGLDNLQQQYVIVSEVLE